MERNYTATLSCLFSELKKPCWDLPFCPNCGALQPDSKINYAFDRQSGELCGLTSVVFCSCCSFSASFNLFCIEDIENGDLKSSLIDYKRQVMKHLPNDWNDKSSLRNCVNAFMKIK